jgi:hypothetical protein
MLIVHIGSWAPPGARGSVGLTSGANVSGTLTMSSGAAVVETLILVGQYTAANFQRDLGRRRRVPRLCRGGSKSLTFTAVVHRRSSRRRANTRTEGNFLLDEQGRPGHKGEITRSRCRSMI